MADFVQVGTFTRSLNDVHGQHVSGDRIIWWVERPAGAQELWRSNDRGVTWTFHAHPTWLAGQTMGSLSQPGASNYWIFNGSTNELTNTPDTNPGAGGFTTNPFAFTGSYHIIMVVGGVVYMAKASASDLRRRDNPSEPPASTLMGNLPGSQNIYVRSIPSTSDVLIANNAVSPNQRVYRVTPSPFSNVNTFTHGEPMESTELGNPLAALSASDYWLGTVGISTGPMTSVQSVNGGTTWTKRFPQTGFFSGRPNPEKAYLTSFNRISGTDRAVATYYDPGDGINHRKFFRLAKFDGTEWIPDGAVTTDAGVVAMTAAGLNAAGDMDVYAATIQLATNTIRVYRLSLVGLQPATPVGLGLEIASPRFNPIRETYLPIVRIY